MVKKKHSEQQETNEKQNHESADNKEHINPDAITEEGFGDSQSASPETEKQQEEKTQETKTTDKGSPEERSAEEKLAEMQDRYLRLSAEFDNYRKRTLREKIDLSKYAAENLLLKLLPVMDDFERAVSHMDAATDCTAMKQGIDLIYTKFCDFLKQNGVKEVESMNCQFNVDLHDAVAKIPVQEDDKKGMIVDVIQKGYYLQDKVIRHSKVVIGE